MARSGERQASTAYRSHAAPLNSGDGGYFAHHIPSGQPGADGSPNICNIRRDLIRVDGGTQLREKIDLETVHDYSEAMDSGAVFPPVVLADGFHRYWANHCFGETPARRTYTTRHGTTTTMETSKLERRESSEGAPCQADTDAIESCGTASNSLLNQNPKDRERTKRGRALRERVRREWEGAARPDAFDRGLIQTAPERVVTAIAAGEPFLERRLGKDPGNGSSTTLFAKCSRTRRFTTAPASNSGPFWLRSS